MDLENWVLELLASIDKAAENDTSFSIELTPLTVKEISEAYNKMAWIEIY